MGSLWHLDFHHGSLQGADRPRPVATAASRWACSTTTRDCAATCSGTSRRPPRIWCTGSRRRFRSGACPRALMTDNGGAMIAEEVTEGLLRLGIVHETTLPDSPYQNGKQESFWATLEGRLLAMLDGVTELTLALLNEATQAWVEIEYNRAVHREIGCSPLERFAQAPDVLRESPSTEALRERFAAGQAPHEATGRSLWKACVSRSPRYRHFRDVVVRYARWDLGRVDLVDPRSGTGEVLYPLDRKANADGQRRRSSPEERPERDAEAPATGVELPPLLTQTLAEYSATGLPPAYLPQKAAFPPRRHVMNAKRLLSLWGLKWNPFSPELPSEALLVTAGSRTSPGGSSNGPGGRLRVDLGRVGHRQVGGAADSRRTPGGASRRGGRRTRKAAVPPRRLLPRVGRRLLGEARPLESLGRIQGPARALAGPPDGHSRIKPVLLIDEAQEMSPEVLSELRILSSADFDARSLLTVVLSGDGRLLERLRHPDLVPLASRIRTRLHTEAASREELSELLSHALAKAGNAALMTTELMDTLVDHAAGNYRLLMTLGGELLAYGMARSRPARREVLPGSLSAGTGAREPRRRKRGPDHDRGTFSAAASRGPRGKSPRRSRPRAGWSTSSGATRRSA